MVHHPELQGTLFSSYYPDPFITREISEAPLPTEAWTQALSLEVQVRLGFPLWCGGETCHWHYLLDRERPVRHKQDTFISRAQRGSLNLGLCSLLTSYVGILLERAGTEAVGLTFNTLSDVKKTQSKLLSSTAVPHPAQYCPGMLRNVGSP
jgi:hypothetical protein